MESNKKQEAPPTDFKYKMKCAKAKHSRRAQNLESKKRPFKPNPNFINGFIFDGKNK